ncbi:MAG: alanine racemase [Candidatus Margulisbacteria bacterium]|nr:alanine racemase [Candidatus Margulisiibacteriota bacterium]
MRNQLIVDLKKFRKNLGKIKKKLKARTKFLAVVKADAYGHGAVQIAKAAIHEGVDFFGVATIDEAIELREAGIKLPILILTEPTDYKILHRIQYYDISLTVYSKEMIGAINRLCKKIKKPLKVHVKVDTGMNRVGVPGAEALEFIKSIKKNKNIIVEGLFTHFSDAGNPDKSYTFNQIQIFNRVLRACEAAEINIPIKHAANSTATLNYPQAHYDMVRVGIAMYKDILTFQAKILNVRSINKYDCVGYSKNYKAPENMKIAVISAGYADGYSRLLSNKGTVIVHGQRCPIIGNVCMDMTMIRLPDKLKVNIGDTVTLIGKEGKQAVTAEQIAELTKTIDYEVMCSIGKRVPRVYVG